MENFYKIPPEIAEKIGRFEYASSKAIDALVGKQKDGTYLISETMYKLMTDHYGDIKEYVKEEDSDKLEVINNLKTIPEKITDVEAKASLATEENIIKEK